MQDRSVGRCPPNIRKPLSNKGFKLCAGCHGGPCGVAVPLEEPSRTPSNEHLGRSIGRLRPNLFHAVHHGALVGGGEVGVALGHGDRLVPQNILDRVQFPAGHHPLRRKRVPQIVEMQVVQAGTRESLPETVLKPSQPTARSVGENEIRSRRPRIVAKEIDHGRIHRDVARLPVLRVPDDDEARIKVQVVPLEVAYLPRAHSRMERHSDYRSEVRSKAGHHKPVTLLARQIPQARIVLGEEPDTFHRTLVEQIPVDRAVEHMTQPAHDSVDRSGLACLALASLPVLELRTRNLADGSVAEFADPELDSVALGLGRLEQ